jgi:hypothetical protein
MERTGETLSHVKMFINGKILFIFMFRKQSIFKKIIFFIFLNYFDMIILKLDFIK